jgi:hypothetical protein
MISTYYVYEVLSWATTKNMIYIYKEEYLYTKANPILLYERSIYLSSKGKTESLRDVNTNDTITRK